ncbi:uncharacterized protein K460DRAFT_167664 [Cucurbitaria berberidis CBS 394.84]|uniref:Uncharacterized protein n=1 Tax=Cucurbitaria berberidis CBS 394.84 TaxID=1168544 RepID=A0A9P4L4L9_9PLEO|nr:uncharacterized protein K460DRAFT_167664 [Cucurbitaria berberidis CBS 394.84]KAF1841459.1 hypothetical protein K460DRAFT_167664 [Cucurbitaria berberidis CBS 394.84]
MLKPVDHRSHSEWYLPLEKNMFVPFGEVLMATCTLASLRQRTTRSRSINGQRSSIACICTPCDSLAVSEHPGIQVSPRFREPAVDSPAHQSTGCGGNKRKEGSQIKTRSKRRSEGTTGHLFLDPTTTAGETEVTTSGLAPFTISSLIHCPVSSIRRRSLGWRKIICMVRRRLRR